MEANAEQKAKEPVRKITLPKANSSTVDEHPIRGKPKSGRVWKTNKDRFATIKRSRRGKTSAQQLAYRDEIKQIKQLSQSIKETRRRENEEKRLRREENKRRRLENERKNEVVQIIRNPAKLKRMRKKQLRMIEKRDISKLNVV
ncbi:coiled-coil domain-containing protein 86 [Anopheles maculipalpis]|uniref:coiled-coil domain-containing protein 86 n=1 Tax=Anopheles maculipalpis TaxID=1496333 RepID=UPI00215975BB|nr:coiled-coil domain-containing protein 86 [Anopheles maculipalpis]